MITIPVLKKQAVIFDLDGTLADSVRSLWHCGNYALEKFGLQPFPPERYQYFAGDGTAMLVRRMLAAQSCDRSDLFEQVKAEYERIFVTDCMYEVHPYDGIVPTLQALKDKGVKLAVLSNKPDANTHTVIHSLFGEETFHVIQGQLPGIERKPSPEGVYRIAERLQISVSDILYVGDTATDMQTGKSAGAVTVGVLWGFRKREELEESHADFMIERPRDLLKFW